VSKRRKSKYDRLKAHKKFKTHSLTGRITSRLMYRAWKSVKRNRGAAGVDKVITLSDHREAEFGNSYGVLIKELRLLARAVFVVDAEGVVRYVQLVKEVADEPDYDAVISAAKELV